MGGTGAQRRRGAPAVADREKDTDRRRGAPAECVAPAVVAGRSSCRTISPGSPLRHLGPFALAGLSSPDKKLKSTVFPRLPAAVRPDRRCRREVLPSGPAAAFSPYSGLSVAASAARRKTPGKADDRNTVSPPTVRSAGFAARGTGLFRTDPDTEPGVAGASCGKDTAVRLPEIGYSMSNANRMKL